MADKPGPVRRILDAVAGHPLLAILVAVATVGGTLFAAFGPGAGAADEETAISVDPVPGPMPRCLTLHGSAPVVEGKELWVAFRASGSSDFFYARPTREEDPTRWRARDTVSDGVAGQTHDFYVFFVDNSFSEFIKSIRPVSADGESAGYFYTTSLPPGVRADRPQLSLVSAEDPEACA